MNALHLTLKFRYLDEIKSGEKKYEYRECTDYWKKRIENMAYDTVILHRGMTRDKIEVKYEGYTKRTIKDFMGRQNVFVYAIPINNFRCQ